MPPVVAFTILTWAAIVLLFFGLVAVLREVRLLRGTIARNLDGFTTAPVEIALGSRFAGRMVLAADTGCPLCKEVARRLAACGVEATVLTHEPASKWAGIADGLEIVSDAESWRAISHLSPPVLMLVGPAGRVRRLVLPVRADEVDRMLALFREEAGNAAEAR